MPFEKGHQYGQRSRMFEGALKRAIAQDDGARLRAAAETLLTKAADGEPWALQMLADRLDGKAAQSVEVKTTRSVEDCSLEELRDRVATLLAGTGQAPSSADESRPVH